MSWPPQYLGSHSAVRRIHQCVPDEMESNELHLMERSLLLMKNNNEDGEKNAADVENGEGREANTRIAADEMDNADTVVDEA